jgi:hypothetical protein
MAAMNLLTSDETAAKRENRRSPCPLTPREISKPASPLWRLCGPSERSALPALMSPLTLDMELGGACCTDWRKKWNDVRGGRFQTRTR